MEDIKDQILNMAADFFGTFGQKEAFTLLLAVDREKVYNDFLKAEAGFNGYKLAILDKGIKNSPYQNQVENYPEYLTMLPSLAIYGAKNFPNIGDEVKKPFNLFPIFSQLKYNWKENKDIL